MENVVLSVVVGVLALCCLALSIMQFMEKGPLLNNAYIYATKEERAKIDKKPHYRQSAIVFALLTAFFACVFFAVMLNKTQIFWIAGFLLLLLLVYAVVSSIKTK